MLASLFNSELSFLLEYKIQSDLYTYELSNISELCAVIWISLSTVLNCISYICLMMTIIYGFESMLFWRECFCASNGELIFCYMSILYSLGVMRKIS